MKIRRSPWLLLCFALILLGCEGSEGPRGPAGPAGPEGPAGSANVIYSEWYSPATWALETNWGVSERTYTMTTASLTQEIIDDGVVLVYLRVVGFSPAIMQLPVTIFDAGFSFLFRARAGSIKVVYYRPASPTTDPGVIHSSNTIRYVLIPGGVLDAAAAGAGITGAQLAGSLESMPYSKVCELFDIPE